MHVRFSMVKGTWVVEDRFQTALGRIDEMLIDPDTGQVIGFFVAIPSFFSSEESFLPSVDILSWGTVVHVRDPDRLAPPEEVLRIAPILAGKRRILGQRIITEKAKSSLGRCCDVQFSTKRFTIEWLFPRKFFFSRTPIPASDIVRVTPAAIIVKEPLQLKTDADKLTAADAVAVLKEVVPTTN